MENLSQDYVRTAFAKGLSEKRVITFHAVRNSLIPLATGVGSMIGIFLGGSYLIEKTFGIDGIGMLGFNALLDKDASIKRYDNIVPMFGAIIPEPLAIP